MESMRGRLLGMRLLMLAAVVFMLGSIAAAPAWGGELPKKLNREIRIVQELFNDVLIESPNWLVGVGGPANGIYVDGVGVIVGFEASLVGRGTFTIGHRHGLLRLLGGSVIIRENDGDDEDYDDEDADDNDGGFWASRHEKRAERRYTSGKEELREALLDCGEALTQLQAADWVIVTVFLTDDDYFKDKKISRYCLKIRASDLRAAADGTLSREQAVTRIVEQEY
jgi:hypothetical protein